MDTKENSIFAASVLKHEQAINTLGNFINDTIIPAHNKACNTIDRQDKLLKTTAITAIVLYGYCLYLDHKVNKLEKIIKENNKEEG